MLRLDSSVGVGEGWDQFPHLSPPNDLGVKYLVWDNKQEGSLIGGTKTKGLVVY